LLASEYLKSDQGKGAGIVYDLRCSHVVPEDVLAAGGMPHRERAGHSFIRKTMVETRSIFGGELTGHFYFRDNFFADSGAIAFAQVLSLLSMQQGALSTLIKPFSRYSQSGELSFNVDDKEARIRELADSYKKEKIDYLDGLTIDAHDWWFNVRKSNTEPLLRLNLEARTSDLLASKLIELKKVLGEPIGA
jgi:phosphomannomutase